MPPGAVVGEEALRLAPPGAGVLGDATETGNEEGVYERQE